MRLSREQYAREEKKILDRKPLGWIRAWNRLRGVRPDYIQENIVVDSNMTVEQIEARTREYIALTVPYEWSHIVCTCLQGKYDNQARTCLECGKIARWRLQKCDVCKNKHIPGGFKHFAWQDGQSITLDNGRRASCVRTCFDCLVEHFGDSDGEVEPPTNVARATPTLSDTSFDAMTFPDLTF